MVEDNRVTGQIEEILKRKGIRPRVLTTEEFMQKVALKIEKVMPLAMERIVDSVINEEMARLGRSQICRYLKKGGCSKGLADCAACDAYKPCRWWQRKPGMKFAYAVEGSFIGLCIVVGIAAFLSPGILKPLVYLWLLLVIISRIHIIILQKILRRYS